MLKPLVRNPRIRDALTLNAMPPINALDVQTFDGRTEMRKALVAVIAAGALAVPSSAIATYGSQPGYDVAQSQTRCSGAGAFGAFGDKGDVVHDFGHVYPGDSNGKPGANGAQTGYNNSHLCGSPQVDQTQ